MFAKFIPHLTQRQTNIAVASPHKYIKYIYVQNVSCSALKYSSSTVGRALTYFASGSKLDSSSGTCTDSSPSTNVLL